MSCKKTKSILTSKILLILTLILILNFSILSSTTLGAALNEELFIKAKNLNLELKAAKKLKIIDVRSSSQYLLGHIPTAVQLWADDLRAQEGWVEELIPSPILFRNILAEKGFNKDSKIIIYSQKNSSWAARLWFIFQFYDYQNVKILKGGYQSWQENDFEENFLPPNPKTGNFIIKDVNNNLIINTATLAENFRNKDFIILDLRSSSEFLGKKTIAAAFRKGRVPNSIHLEWSKLFDSQKNLKNSKELLEIFGKKIKPNSKKTIVLLSNKGIRAAHAFLILKSLNYQKLKVYDEGWLGWSSRSELPLELN